jgi:hypothetical protein
MNAIEPMNALEARFESIDDFCPAKAELSLQRPDA